MFLTLIKGLSPNSSLVAHLHNTKDERVIEDPEEAERYMRTMLG